MGKICKHYIVKGRVQGVFFRDNTESMACRLGVTGWVRNLSNGDVEVTACGSSEAVQQLELWLWQGPAAASVESVIAEEVPLPSEEFESFHVRY